MTQETDVFLQMVKYFAKKLAKSYQKKINFAGKIYINSNTN